MSASAKPRVLFLARSCDIAGMIVQLAARSDASCYCAENSRDAVPPGMHLFTLRAAWKLRREIRDGKYDLVISCSVPDPLWRQDENWIGNAIKCLRKLVVHPGALGLHLVPWMLGDSKVPLAVYDWDDNTIIARKNWGLLKRATCYFKTRSPRNPYKAFLFQDKRNDCLFNIIRQPVYGQWIKKLRPFCVGVTVPENWRDPGAVEKKTDVFFAGSDRDASAGLDGVRLLEELRQEGFKIDLQPTDLPREEFLRRCSEAWLVWSPEGAGRDGLLPEWALLAGSVPLLNLPDTRRHLPLIDGIHAFYYGVEDDDLKRVVRLALKDKARLRRMAAEGAAFVLPRHTHPALAEHLITETLRTAAAG